MPPSIAAAAHHMFTGIVERKGEVLEVEDHPGGRRLHTGALEAGGVAPWSAVELGESIAINGVCLTAVAAAGARLAFDVVPETLEKTTLGALRRGDRVNIERSLRAGDRLGGHYVTGHVDGVATVRDRRVVGDQEVFEIAAPAPLLLQMVAKGSVAVDGISLTIVTVDRAAGCFTFAAIPHTLERTVLGERAAGDAVNLETDAFGKWVLQALERWLPAGIEELAGPRSRKEPRQP